MTNNDVEAPRITEAVEVELDDQGRPEPPLTAPEIQTLLGFLDFLRATMEWRVRGLDSQALNRRLDGHSSPMTLGGMMKHLAFVEFHWFEVTAHGEATSEPWVSVDWDADPDWDWHSATHESPEQVLNLWRTQVNTSSAIMSTVLSRDGDAALDATFPAWGGRDHVSLRWILTHMIEEYARHCGHADLLREQIDGVTGE